MLNYDKNKIIKLKSLVFMERQGFYITGKFY